VRLDSSRRQSSCGQILLQALFPKTQGKLQAVTTNEFHSALHDSGFYRTGTGGGCDALIRTFEDDARIIMTCAEDPSVPEADEDVCIGFIFCNHKQGGCEFPTLQWTTTADEALRFARNLTYYPEGPPFLL